MSALQSQVKTPREIKLKSSFNEIILSAARGTHSPLNVDYPSGCI